MNRIKTINKKNNNSENLVNSENPDSDNMKEKETRKPFLYSTIPDDWEVNAVFLFLTSNTL